MQLRQLALGLGAFIGGTAALAVGVVALASRRQGGDAGTASAPTDAEPLAPLATTDGPAPNHEQRHDQSAPATGGHAAPDLAADAASGPNEAGRAPAAFRPDMDAPMTAAEREALRPATGPQPTLVDAGTSLPA